MKVKLIRGLSLILVLSLVVIIFSPSSKVVAQCAAPGTQTIEVDNGLISAFSLSNFKAISDVSCISSSSAVIPQFALTTYADMKSLYYDQATCTGCKNPFTGNQTQNTAKDVINLSEVSVSPTPTPTLTPTPTPSPAPSTGNPLQIDNIIIQILNNIISI